MNILCFASATAMLEKVSGSVINFNAHGVAIERYKSLDELYRRLCQPKNSDYVAILYLKNKKEISEIIAMQDLFSGTKIILVLPKRDKDFIKTAYKIFPRFLTFADEDFSDISRIVEKMISRAQV